MLLLSGVQLMILGIVGEYLGRLYLTANGKPQSVVKEVRRSEALARRRAAAGSPARARVNRMALYYTSLAAAILFAVAGQIALKSAAENSASVIAQFLNPLTIDRAGDLPLRLVLLHFRAAQDSVSIALPSVAASYALIAVVAHVLWNEPLGWPQVGGILLISGGVLLLNQH